MLYQMENQHGGDVYGGGITLDFSANTNPLGTPPSVLEAVCRALPQLHRYPDPYCRRLVQAIAGHEQVPASYILCGNGAADLIYAYCAALRPRTAVELAHRFPHIYAAVGIHPENCGDFRPEHLTEIRALAQEDKVVAIGEIGLDYYWPENPPRDLQQQVLRQQLALAQELQLPVIIHDRDAHADTMDIVREFPRVRGVFHCFAGSVEMARELVDRGWYLSFNGAATFKNARKAPEVIRAVPMERLMIETDAPYLTPVPYRGRRNDSTYVHLVAERIAQLRDMTPAAVEQATWDNGKGFFGI